MSQDLVLSAGKALSLLDDIKLIEAIGKTVQKEAELKAKLPGSDTALAVLQKFAGKLDAPEIATAFTQVGLAPEYEVLKAGLPKLADAATGLIPAKYQPLLKPLSAFKIGAADAVVSWTISTSDKPVVKTDTYALNLGASATLTFNAGDQRAGAAPPVKLLSIDAKGNLTAGGSATLTYPLGTVGLKADASAGLELQYLYKPGDTEIFAIAVAECASHLTSPFDFDSVYEKLQTTNLDGIVFTFKDAASAQIDVSLADAAAFAAGRVKANIAGKVTVTAKYSSGYTLNVLKEPGSAGAMRVKLSRDSTSSAGGDASLGLEVDYSDLVKPVITAIDAALGKWDTTLDTIRPFLSPGTWLQNNAKQLLATEVGKIVSDQGLRAALINDLDVGLGADPSADGLAKWLTDKLSGAIDSGSVLVSGDLKTAAGKVTDILKTVSPALSQAAGSKLTDLVNSAVKQANDGLKAEVDKLVTPTGDALMKALKDAGATVTALVNKADDALANVRAMLKSIDDNLHTILKGAENALKQKVTARLYLSETHSSGTTVEVDGTINAPGDDSRKIFEALTRGRLTTIVDIVDGTVSAPNFTLAKETSKITRFSDDESERGVELSFLGIELTAKELVSTKVATVVDGFGNVHVNTQDSVKKIFSSPWDTREASFVESYALLAAAQMAAAGKAPVLELGIEASYTDPTLEWKNVADFIAGLWARHLVSDDATANAKAAFDAWNKSAGGTGKISGSIGAALRLNGPQIATLLKLDQYEGGLMKATAQQAIVKTALTVLRDVGGLKDQQFETGAQTTLGHFMGHPATLPEEVIVVDYPAKVPRVDQPPTGAWPEGNVPGMPSDEYVYFLQQAYCLRQLVDLIVKMGAIYQSKPAVGAGAGWSVDDYRNNQRQMASDCRRWVKVAGAVDQLFKPDITPRTLAFMRTMATLAGIPAGGGVVLTMTYTPAGGGEAQTAAFK